jgi:biopolymer transport protein ExbB
MRRAEDHFGADRLRGLGGTLIAKVFAAALSVCLYAASALAQAPAPAETAVPTAAPKSTPASEAAPPVSPRSAATPTSANPAADATKSAATAEGSLPSDLPHDLSPWGMFLHANLIVKGVMVGLAFASLITWTVWVAKSLELSSAERSARRGLKILASAPSLRGAQDALGKSRAPVARLVAAAVGEADRSAGLPADGVKERIAALLSRVEAHAGRVMTRGTGTLATIGSTAPFVGLFGTVWGIMDSFIGISKSHTTNLAVVAPGIAEALLATAMGLVAAIPAVMIYNVFARSIAGYRARLADASAEVLRHISRDLDREAAPRRKDDGQIITMRTPAE